MNTENRKSKTIVPVVIDTNTLVFSLFRKKNLYRFIVKGNLFLIWNNHIYDEAEKIGINLYHDLFQYTSDAMDIASYLLALRIVFDPANKVDEMPEDWPSHSPDRDDDPFLFAAEQGGAEYIITKDNHLLKLGNFKDIPIGKPEDFFDWAKKYRPL